jgi:hypothetical protein
MPSLFAPISLPLLFFLTKKVTKKSGKKEMLRTFFRAYAQIPELKVSSLTRSVTFLPEVASLFNETLIKCYGRNLKILRRCIPT